ncbi:MAG: M2 family metallopeptidase, partial [Myxococcota bacterium]|nr:M2 family metallopeptidase [Myxococcota bacterium]
MTNTISEAICCSEGPRRFLADYEAVVRPIVHRSNQAYWAFSCTGEPKHQDTIQEMEEAFSDLHASERVHAEIARWLDQPPVDPLVHRQLQLLFREYRRSQAPETLRKRIIKLSLKVEETVSLFRPEFRGQRIEANQLDRMLLKEEDEEIRRAAWTATRQVGARVLNPTRELVALRNELAQHLGFSDYFALALDDEEMDVSFSSSILEELLVASEEPWNDTKRALDQELSLLRG